MKNRIGYLYVIITCFIWGSVYIASKYALASIGPLTVLCIRYLVAGACLAVLLNMRRTRRTVKKGDWKYIWIVGGLGYFCLHYVPAGGNQAARRVPGLPD